MRDINYKGIAIFFLALLSSVSCADDSVTETEVTFNFSFNWAGTAVSIDDLNEIKYTNQNGDKLSISRLKYLISDISFNTTTSTIESNEYALINMTEDKSYNYTLRTRIPAGSYDNIAFNFGFDEEDNAGTYVDLNSVNWNWPDMFGGGYHNMQYEGKFLDRDGLEQSYALHMGTAKKDIGDFEANFFSVKLPGVGLQGREKVTIEIKMDISEWYKNPILWDLNKFNVPLMSNYEAQLQLNDNGRDVFSLGEIN